MVKFGPGLVDILVVNIEQVKTSSDHYGEDQGHRDKAGSYDVLGGNRFHVVSQDRLLNAM